MIFLYSILLVIAGILGLLIFLPFVILIDSDRKLVEIKFKYFAGLRILFQHGNLNFYFLFLFFKFKIQPSKLLKKLKFKNSKKQLPAKKSKQKKAKPISLKKTFKIIKLFIKDFYYSFKIIKFNIQIDTDNYFLNGIIIPIVHLANFRKINIEVNFDARNFVVFEVQTRLFLILWAFIKAVFRYYRN